LAPRAFGDEAQVDEIRRHGVHLHVWRTCVDSIRYRIASATRANGSLLYHRGHSQTLESSSRVVVRVRHRCDELRYARCETLRRRTDASVLTMLRGNCELRRS
jgi:hypothetical protein